MPYASLTVGLPGTVWIGDVSRSFPDATFRVLSAVPTDGTGFGLLDVESDDLSRVLDAVEDRDDVSSVRVMHRTDGTAVVQFETADPLLLHTIQESGAPIELPLTIRDGEATVELTASRDHLAAFGRQLDAFGMSYTLDRVYERSGSPDLLTDRQRTLLVRAVERGYYDTPRECTLTELADDVGLAKSTVSVTLHRAEETVVKEFVSRNLDVDLDATARAQATTE
jgi:predicted DNA binding protein